MIVVEGPDGGGKTTLIQVLREAYPELPLMPRVVSKMTQAMTDLKAWTEDNVNRGWQSSLFDRHRLISEPIYGPLLRTEPQDGFDDFTWFSYHLAKFYSCQPVVIYCIPPLETILQNLMNDDDNSVVFRFTREIYGAYINKAATELTFRDFAYIYDYTAYDAADQLDLILTGIRTRLDMEETYDVQQA